MNADAGGRPATLGACATLACLWEATAAKPGNVYRGADFDDMTYADFLTSAAAIGPVFDRCGHLGLGGTVLEAVRATRRVVEVNTNLGTLLLLAPLALAGGNAAKAKEIVRKATDDDTAKVYQAIRTAMPGGMGEVAEGDVSLEPEHSLVEAMELAAERDLVARQYTNGFADVMAASDAIAKHRLHGQSLHDAIVATFLGLLAKHGDSLVARKLGREASYELSRRARSVLQHELGSPEYHAGVADFDFWLRADGHRRNPGTAADLIAAALFVLLAEDRLSWPVRFYG